LVWRDQCRIGVSFDMERAAEIVREDGPVEQSARPRRVLLGRERSLAHLVSVLRFVGLTDKTAVLARTDASPASECRDLPDKYGAERG
jgi:hypothetical protein